MNMRGRRGAATLMNVDPNDHYRLCARRKGSVLSMRLRFHCPIQHACMTEQCQHNIWKACTKNRHSVLPRWLKPHIAFARHHAPAASSTAAQRTRLFIVAMTEAVLEGRSHEATTILAAWTPRRGACSADGTDAGRADEASAARPGGVEEEEEAYAGDFVVGFELLDSS